MFTRTRTSRAGQARAQVVDATSAASHQLRERVGPAVDRARDAREWATPHARDAREWATPRVEKGLEAAAPKVEAAVDRLTPAVDALHDKIVDDLLPRLVDVVNAAAAAGLSAGSDAADTAKSRGGGAVAVIRGEAIAKPHRRRGRTLLLVLTALSAAGAAAFAVFKRQAPQDDPWAVPESSYPTPSPVPAGGTSDDDAPLATGDASDALDASGGTLADADVPGLTVDSAAAQDAATESTGDPLTDPIERVHQASVRDTENDGQDKGPDDNS